MVARPLSILPKIANFLENQIKICPHSDFFQNLHILSKLKFHYNIFQYKLRFFFYFCPLYLNHTHTFLFKLHHQRKSTDILSRNMIFQRAYGVQQQCWPDRPDQSLEVAEYTHSRPQQTQHSPPYRVFLKHHCSTEHVIHIYKLNNFSVFIVTGVKPYGVNL